MYLDKKILVVIPARGGSKGIPYKNIKNLNGKPLITYSIDVARQIVSDEHICVSTDDEKIKKVVEDYGLKVPFLRPDDLATDTATTNDVLLHTIQFYEREGILYDIILLLQPTSPLRTEQHLKEALALYQEDCDMVVSVRKSHAPVVLCQEDERGYLESLFNRKNSRRQDLFSFYEYNGAIYIINVKSLKNIGLSNFEKKIKYVMDDSSSIDIDTPIDWEIAEYFLRIRNKNVDMQIVVL